MNIGYRILRALGCMSAAAALCIASPVRAVEVAGVKLDDTVRVANQDLKLNGAGMRYKAVFKVYVVGLYLTDKKQTVQEVLAASGARRVSIVMQREMSNEELGRAFVSGIQQNSDRTEKAKIIMQLQKFGEIFASVPEIKKGEMLTLDWVPGSGTMVYLNGKQISDVLPDIAFYNALLRIWLGDKPADAKLKPLLLGQKPDEGPRAGNAF